MSGKGFPLFLMLLLLVGIADDGVACLTTDPADELCAAANNTYLFRMSEGRQERPPGGRLPPADGLSPPAAPLAVPARALGQPAPAPVPALVGLDLLYLLMSLQR